MAAHLPLLVGAALLVPVTAVAVTAGVRYSTAPPTTTAPPSSTGPAGPSLQLTTIYYQRIDFDDVEVGKTSAVKELRLSSNGGAPLAIRSLVASVGFAQTNDCGGRVLPRANCAVRVTFAPRAVGGQSGTLTITHDGPGSPHTIALSGTGRVPRPQ